MLFRLPEQKCTATLTVLTLNVDALSLSYEIYVERPLNARLTPFPLSTEKVLLKDYSVCKVGLQFSKLLVEVQFL